MEMRLVLVESNAELRGKLWNMLALYRVFRLVAEVETVTEAMNYIASHEVDLVFTNRLPAYANRNSYGAYLSAILAHTNPDIQVVMYSDKEEDAYHACWSQCAGFLLKPFDPLALQMLVNRLTYICDLQQTKRETANRSIMIKTRSGYRLTRIQDILFIERSNRKNRIVTESGEEIVLLGCTMNEIEQMLEGSGFYRCYQSFIVNLSKVSFIRADNDTKNYAIQFHGFDGEIMLSRDRYSEIVSLLKEKYAKINI